MNNKVLLLSLCFFLSVLACRAQHIGDYVLNISKINQDEGNMHVSCFNPAKRNVLDLKNETCKNQEKRNVLKKSHTRHLKAIKKQSKTGCFYSFWTANKRRSNEVQIMRH